MPQTVSSYLPLLAYPASLTPPIFAHQSEAVVKKLADKLPDIGRKVEYLLNTGNLVSRSGLDLSQAAGFTVVAEKLNFFR